ncbi:ankyrin containing protein [Coprinopsis cinerea okayama7|uniref:Ankyrin containing protein n=1 Tax=Coprinopsis cinerea (strain Okayama-7 / 130 / ATCC MYA-4618 / FGSC 9003) TaxID=240176 RepID=A8N3G4_COPC7|nr:ankyrin containing protein [Coprinopsis cinerea okayama7\|eukprot:XP_001829541.2 ankyrin containing protein [Coprinopsis cinerea okayama7\
MSLQNLTRIYTISLPSDRLWEKTRILRMIRVDQSGQDIPPSTHGGPSNVTIHGGIFNKTGRVINHHHHYHGYPNEGQSIDRPALDRILSRLVPKVNFRAIYLDVQKKCTRGTGEWFIRSRLYREWKNSTCGILWGMGMPGAGKTVLSSTVIKDLLRLEQESDDVSVVFVFCRYTEPLSVKDILEAIIKEYLEQHPFLISVVEPLYSRHELTKTEPSEDELVTLLADIETFFRKSFYALDGVDEARNDVQFDLIKLFNSLQGNIILFSRPLDELGTYLDYAVLFSVSAQAEDLEVMIADKLDRHVALRRILSNPEHKLEVVRSIQEKSAGMMLHASLQIEALQGCATIKSVRRRLEEFPAKLEDMYEATMQRIEAQPPELADLAKRALLWLVFAQRTLDIEELLHFLSYCPETGVFDQEQAVDQATLLAVCCGLIDITRYPYVGDVRLVHFTAKDALEAILRRKYPSPHALLLRTCLELLVDRSIPHWREARLRSPHAPVIDYAYVHWANHAKACSDDPHIKDVPLRFLQRCASYPMFIRGDLDFVGPLHMVAQRGLRYILEPSAADVIRAYGWDVNGRTDLKGATALSLASPEVLDLLLEVDGIDVNARDQRGQSPLMYACLRVDENSVSRLLGVKGVDVNIQDDNGYTALMLALESCWLAGVGHGIVDCLLKHDGILVNTANSGGVTPLMLASRHCGNTRLVHQLLQFEDIDVDAKCNTGQTALSEAVTSCLHLPHVAGDACGENIVDRLLQSMSIDAIISTDHEGRTAVMQACAAFSECGAVVRRLLHVEGIPLDTVDRQGHTALSLASDTIVDILLEHASHGDFNAWAQFRQTGLWSAARWGRTSTVEKLLMIGGIDVNGVNAEGRTPLMLACDLSVCFVPDDRRYRTAKVLVEHEDIDLDRRDKDGKTALMIAADNDMDEIVENLLQHGASREGFEFIYGIPDWFFDDDLYLYSYPHRPLSISEPRGEL